MLNRFKIHVLLCDRNVPLCAAWKQVMPWADIRCGHIFERRATALVSPANSFGFMDGGIDLVYIQRFGRSLQDRLQKVIANRFDGELLVGQAVEVATGDPEIPWLISAPTMRVPMAVYDPVDIELATAAAMRVALRSGFDSILFPGMGTGCGQVHPAIAARHMALGISNALHPQPFPRTLAEAASRHYRYTTPAGQHANPL